MNMEGDGDGDVCTKPGPCPFEIGYDRRADVCYFPPASISPLSDIHCAPLPPPVILDNVGDSYFVPDMSQPIVTSWPNEAAESYPVPSNKNKVDILTRIPDETYPLVAKVIQHPEGDVIKETLNHPLCPDAQLTLTITPPIKKPTEIRIPECKVPSVRPPQRSWVQCVENQRISDRVRRPMARVCHRREIPPIVIPIDRFQKMQLKVTEKERKKAEHEAACMERECERLKSRYRHSLWNYTVESLLDEKRKEEKKKQEESIASDTAMVTELKAVKDAESLEARSRAQKMMLYRKGLIRDFHSSMENSMLLKNLADEAQQTNRCEEQEISSPPFLNKVCLQKLRWVDNRPEYEKRVERKPCSKKLLELIQMDEKRVYEREAVLTAEKMAAEALRHEETLPLPESYLKSIQEPKCDLENLGNEEKLKKAERRKELYEDIHNRLSLDAFIEARENEQERQAHCFNHYIRERNRIVKQKEKQLIDEKVKRNTEASEKAAAVLLEMQSKKQGRADAYNELREQWEKEYENKVLEKQKLHGKLMGLVYKDFWQRRNEELCKRQLSDASRHWARERLDAVENFSMDCEVKAGRRLQAEELALYHKAQIADKKSREDKAKHLDCVYGFSAKKAQEDEMEEMRNYAHKCMEDWAAKGRSIQPMVTAMKKWDYEGGMYPHPFIIASEYRQIADGAKTTNTPSYNTTSNRLGFCSGGT